MTQSADADDHRVGARAQFRPGAADRVVRREARVGQRGGDHRVQAVPQRDEVVSLYAGGMTVRDVQHHLMRVYGAEISPDAISGLRCAMGDLGYCPERRGPGQRPGRRRRHPCCGDRRAGAGQGAVRARGGFGRGVPDAPRLGAAGSGAPRRRRLRPRVRADCGRDWRYARREAPRA
jgi:hypothetical protein